MDLEAIYDEQIAPLMQQILDIAQAHQMPLVMSFQLTDGAMTPDDGPLLCSSVLLYENTCDVLREAKFVLLDKRRTRGGSVLTLRSGGTVIESSVVVEDA